MACQYCNTENPEPVFPIVNNPSYPGLTMYIDQLGECVDICKLDMIHGEVAIATFPINYCPMCRDSWCGESLGE